MPAGGVRNICFTWNNYDCPHRIFDKLKGHKHAQFVVFGLEVGEEEGTPHLQGYMKFDNNMRFASVHKFMEKNYLEL